jgi:hypothetical protein
MAYVASGRARSGGSDRGSSSLRVWHACGRNGETWRAGTHRRAAAIGGEAPADGGGSRESQGALGVVFLVLLGSSRGRVSSQQLPARRWRRWYPVVLAAQRGWLGRAEEGERKVREGGGREWPATSPNFRPPMVTTMPACIEEGECCGAPAWLSSEVEKWCGDEESLGRGRGFYSRSRAHGRRGAQGRGHARVSAKGAAGWWHHERYPE